jgi:hypothetical protein
MKYKIEYILHEKDKETTNSRLYKALDPSTAKEMFNETCSEGSLTGEDVELKAIYTEKENNWEKITDYNCIWK